VAGGEGKGEGGDKEATEEMGGRLPEGKPASRCGAVGVLREQSLRRGDE
jgi:hypothetical protein